MVSAAIGLPASPQTIDRIQLAGLLIVILVLLWMLWWWTVLVRRGEPLPQVAQGTAAGVGKLLARPFEAALDHLRNVATASLIPTTTGEGQPEEASEQPVAMPFAVFMAGVGMLVAPLWTISEIGVDPPPPNGWVMAIVIELEVIVVEPPPPGPEQLVVTDLVEQPPFEAACRTGVLVAELGADPELAAAWAEAAGAAVDGIPDFVGGLAAVALPGDTWVTLFSHQDGGVDALQVLLDRGTEVLIDGLAVPRVLCASGAPLGQPERVERPRFPEGTGTVLVLEPMEEPQEEIPVRDRTTGVVRSQPIRSDVTPPRWPAGAELEAATGADEAGLELAWPAAADPSGIEAYRVYLAGELAAEVAGDQLTASFAAAAFAELTVQAVDTFGNESHDGPASAVDLEPPRWEPGDELRVVATRPLMLRWDRATDDDRVAGYVLRRDGAAVAEFGPSENLVEVHPVTCAAASFVVVAADPAGNVSDPGLTLVVPAEDRPPAWAAGGELRAGNVSETEVTLEWDAATDDCGLAGYLLTDVGGILELPAGTVSFAVDGLEPETAYAFSLDAIDTAGHTTGEPLRTQVTTTGGGGPTWPAGASLTATAAGPTWIELRWTAAEGDVAGYVLSLDGVPVADVPGGVSAVRHEGLAPYSEHTYTVAAVSDSGSTTPGPSTTAATDPPPTTTTTTTTTTRPPDTSSPTTTTTRPPTTRSPTTTTRPPTTSSPTTTTSTSTTTPSTTSTCTTTTTTTTTAPTTTTTTTTTTLSCSITPGAFCTPPGATSVCNGVDYVCSNTNTAGEPYTDGRYRWRRA